MITMIDVEQFLVDLWTPLEEHTTVGQIVLADQKVPPEQLKVPRLVYNMIMFGDTHSRQGIISTTALVESKDEEHDEDIEYSHLSHPQATLSVNGYGAGAGKHVREAREWFYTPGLADQWMRDHDCVIRDVLEMQNRTVWLETDWEARLGFDVRLEFADLVKVRVGIIETVEVNEQEFKG